MAPAELGLKIAFYIYPCILFITLLGAQSLQFYRDRHRDPRRDASDEPKPKDRPIYTRLIWFFQLVLSLLVLVSIVLVTREAVAGKHEVGGTVGFAFSAYLASHVGVLLYFLAGLLPDPEGPWSPGAAHCCAWVTGALVEIVIVAVLSFAGPSLRVSKGFFDILNVLGLSRVAILILMVATLILKEYKLASSEPKSVPEERQSLLENGNGVSGYSSVPTHMPAGPGPTRRTQVSGTGWLDYFAGFRVLFPYLWPKDSPVYQAIVFVCLILLVGQRTVNVLAPVQLGVLVDALGEGRLPYKEITLYVVYRALQGNNGALGAARSVLWIPVAQSLFRKLSAAAFEHVLGLSLEFHVNKKVGEVTSALSRGAAINTFLESFCFQVFPMVFDIFVAGVFFFVKYDPFYTIIVFFIMWSYIFLTIYLAKYRGKQRRDMTIKTREMEAIKTDAIVAYETVQHNCAIPRETERFKEHVAVFQRAERLVQWSLNGLNLTQSSIFALGTALLVAVSAYKISIGEQTVGEFVSLINYFVQLQGPLNFFGTYYTMLQNNLIEAERLLDLFKETSGIVEKPDAVGLPSPRGEVAFNDVKFAYQSKRGELVLDGISFTVAPGTKTAIVGESGSGKSTCLKLLRRRNGQPSRTSLRAEAVQPKEASTTSSPEMSETPETRQKKWDEWDAARKELSQLSSSGPFAHHELFLRVSMDEIPVAPRPGHPRKDENNLDGTEESNVAAEAHTLGLDKKPSLKTLEIPVSTGAAPQTPAESRHSGISTVLHAAFAGGHAASQSTSLNPTIKPASLPAEDSRHLESQGSLEESLVALDDLIAEFKSPGADQAVVAEGQDSAIEVLRRLISSEFLAPQSALLRGLRILQSVVSSQQHSKIPTILDTLRPVCKEICLLAVPAMDCLHANHDTEGASKLLRHLFQSPVWKSENTPHNLRNTWVTRMLMHYWRKTQNFSEIKSIYQLLQDAGLFANGFLSPITQYSIRRRIALTALDAGDDATAKTEMERLRQLRPKASEYDVKLRGRFAIRDASLGNWEAVWPQVQGLTARGKTGDQYQNVLCWLTKIYCKDHSAAEIDIFVQDLVASHGMTLNQPLAFIIIDRHGRNRDIHALVKWLQYCYNGGLEPDQIFFNEVVEKCCKYWNLTRVDVVHMLKGVREFMPWIHDPHVAKYSVRGALSDLHKSLPGEDSKEDSFGLVSKLPNTPGDSLTAFERTAFRCMNTWALENNWQRVYGAFKEASDKGIGFSSRCLRLAVIANINMEGAHSCTATELVGKAHVEGHDVSGALVPLLVARLESGDSVGRLLQEALSQGTHVHDSVYNKAARILTQKGFQEGAIRVCELAAQQNGDGELAYSQFNFASLIYLFTGQRRYDDLRSLVMSFTCKSEWWQGSKECKESLKRAIKAVATRVARSAPTNQEIHEEALMYLNQALAHIKALRATTQQDRVVLTQEVVGAFKQMDQVRDLKLETLEEEGTMERRPHSARISWETPPARSRNTEQLDEGIHQDGQMRMEQSKSLRSSKAEPSQQKMVRAKELANEQEDMFIARQSLAGAFFGAG